MKDLEFYRIAKEYFGSILGPRGFSVEQSKFSTFYRPVSEDIYHVIMPDLGRDKSWFDIRVFAVSSLIEPEFEYIFPDELRIPSDRFSLLHPITGVGMDQKKFPCRTEEGFIRNFKKDVSSALENKALPYLNKINSLRDLLPYIKSDFYLGCALWHTGEKGKAQEILLTEKLRLEKIKDDSGRANILLGFIETMV